jgi:hypothetical protein
MSRRKIQKKTVRKNRKNKRHTRRRKTGGNNKGVYTGTSRIFTEKELADCKYTAEGCNPQD